MFVFIAIEVAYMVALLATGTIDLEE